MENLNLPYTQEEVNKITTWFEVPSNVYEYCLEACSSVDDRKTKLLAMCYMYFDQVHVQKLTKILDESDLPPLNHKILILFVLLCRLIIEDKFKHTSSFYENLPGGGINLVLAYLEQVQSRLQETKQYEI